MVKKKHLLLFILTIFLMIPLFPQAEKVPIQNGLAIIYDKNLYSETSIVHILILGGKKAEPYLHDGLAYLSTRLSLEMHDDLKLQKLVELGSRFDFQVEGDYCLIIIRCLSTYLEDTMEIFTDIFSQPLFSSLRINKVKQQADHLQKTESADDIKLMKLTLRNTFFGSPGYGGSIYGNSDSFRRIGKNEISDFYKKYFCKNNMCIAVSSDLNKSRIIEIFSRTLPKISSGENVSYNQQKSLIPPERKFFISKEKKQLLISFSACSSMLHPTNFPKIFLLQNLISKGMGSLLWRLREEGLSYLTEADVIQLKDSGILSVYIRTEKDKKENAYIKLKNLLLNLVEKDFGEEELMIHKNHAKADFFRLNETKENRCFNLGFFEILGLGYQYVEKLVQEIDAITLEDFNSFKKEVLQPSHLVEVIIGPEDISSK